jgi:N-acetylglutamate synthase-like GNAT family acetyltransferase
LLASLKAVEFPQPFFISLDKSNFYHFMLSNIRSYNSKDRAEVLEIFRLNSPEYFDPSEENDLKNYLQNELEDYFVIHSEDQILGAGGINYEQLAIAIISWDLIHPDYQKMGLGRQLLEYRLQKLKKENRVDRVIVRTSQFAYKFYASAKFELLYTKPNYWARNFDLYFMRLKI